GALLAAPAQAAVIQRTITIDGVFGDWDPAPAADPCPAGNITCNPGQSSTDPEDNTTPPGRDLRAFAYTFDQTKLYLFMSRYAISNNNTDWWFYIDVDADGRLEVGEKVLQIDWATANRHTQRSLYDYEPADTVNGDALVDPVTLSGDGYMMPGGVHGRVFLDASNQLPIGGSVDGLSMETELAWTQVKADATGPFSVGFHIASSNGTNLPNNIIDDMSGPEGGSTLVFADPFVTKSGPVRTASGFAIPFEITVGNNGPDSALGVRVTDRCEALDADRALAAGESFAYTEHVASAGTTYDPADVAGDVPDLGAGVWTIGTLASGATATLTLYCTVTVLTPIAVTNTASITEYTSADTDTSAGSNTATNQPPVTVIPLPALTVLKTSNVVHDPINEDAFPKRIPGSCIRYTVQVQNTGPGPAETIVIGDALPGGLELYLGDPGELPAECGGSATPGGSPIAFDQGNNDNGDAPLTYSFLGLNSDSDGIAFYDSADQETVVAGDVLVAGFDPDIAKIVVMPTGTMRGTADDAGTATGDSVHVFTFTYLVRVQ
ncbi:MAG TPA: DUF11 domain-containing protein, partial [Pseudomonadales bacterium]|nr:DUF11 domain-containing protein [Pseudomonadales bacterium]